MSVDNVFVPNDLTIYISVKDYDHLQKIFSKMIVELENYILAHAEEKDYRFPSDVKIAIEKDEDLKVGDLRIETRLNEETLEKAKETKNNSHTQIISAEEAAELGLYSSENEALLIHLETGSKYSIDKDIIKIGRLEDNDIIISDPSVSRHHAELSREGPTYIIRDLGSTNGSKINQSPMKEAILEDEDCITLGKTDFIFRS